MQSFPFLRSCPRWLATAFSIVLLAACSGHLPPSELTGMSRDQIVARWGTPETQRALPGGATRLEYPGGPYGKQTWFIELDAAGRAIRAEQVLTERNFNQITPGMAQDELRQRLGRPGEVRMLGRSRGVVWSWRFHGPFCLWFEAEIDADGRVRSAGYGEPPECDRPNEIIIKL